MARPGLGGNLGPREAKSRGKDQGAQERQGPEEGPRKPETQEQEGVVTA